MLSVRKPNHQPTITINFSPRVLTARHVGAPRHNVTVDTAKDLFDKFVQQGMDMINEVVASRWSESSSLDFKLAAKGKPPLDATDKKNLSKALSEFANTDGGLIVWGVVCERAQQDDVDVAKALKPISGLKSFEAELNNLTGQLTNPGVEGVIHHIILENAEEVGCDCGFVISYIPRSDGPLHMATAKDEHRFYHRSGSSFRVMESSHVADRYSRRPPAKLLLKWSFFGKTGTSHRVEKGELVGAQIDVEIRNDGRGLAFLPALKLKIASGNATFSEFGIDGANGTGLPERPMPRSSATPLEKYYAAKHNEVVYPGTILTVTRLKVRYNVGDLTIPDVVLEYELFWDGGSARDTITISALEIREYVNY